MRQQDITLIGFGIVATAVLLGLGSIATVLDVRLKNIEREVKDLPALWLDSLLKNGGKL